MDACVFSLLTILCVGLFGESAHAEECTDPTVTPSSLAVALGDPVHVTCSIPSKPAGSYTLGFESSLVQPTTNNETSVTLQLDRLMRWVPDAVHQCYLSLDKPSLQCLSYFSLSIYKKPDRVTLSSVPDVWVEGDQTELLCEIIDIGPGRALSVSWSRTDPELNSTFTQFNETFFPELKNEANIVNKTARLKVTPRREDDGAQYQCEAVLNLSQHGSRVFTSQPINITVHYRPVITPQFLSEVLSVLGENLTLSCQADGNPSPVYSWTLSNGTKISNSSSINIRSVHEEDQGWYTCTTSNYLGHDTRIVILTVIQKPDRVTLSSVPDVWVEGDQTELLCEIIDIGPGRALSVSWSRTDPELNSTFTQFNETFFPELKNEANIVNKTARLKVTPRREDDGAQYQCEAVLNLSQHGSRVFTSQPINITVHSPHNPYFLSWILISITVLVLVLLLVFTVCWMHYRRTHMGQYILKQLRSHRHTSSVDHNAEAQRQL
ncbi:hemicentin-1-like isoform X2 [Neoarius graeffei]|uniref:hemicentin-1-like isoform X2 n=1 Tax=Neoarius graeffei TaxID=443677 RepID=UPI00298CF70A|nr:hemicentin-1-like isoform X2 [Neoarius graeffei]